MTKLRIFGRPIWKYLSIISPVLLFGGVAVILHADTPLTTADYQKDPARMLEAFRHVEAASVSDAEEQLLHEKHYMSHRMQPIFPTKFAGTALTVLLKKEENRDPDALSGMLAAIDSGGQGSIKSTP